ncbi:MAG: hypothetical protein KJ600_02410 [Nanoarchaeota archaeon]|nr:hypothetical protein [Nanoarchaeota archaeon]MBU1103386.1 hypothetical protein [Nanoarchaeota archaeon]
MRIRTKEAFILIFFIALFSTLTSAELLLGQTESLYNFGDKFEITIKISSQKYTSNFLTASLICSGKQIEIYKSPHTVESGSEKEILISTNLDKFLVEDAQGDCFIRAKYGGEESESQKFEITKSIGVTLTMNGILFDPGDQVNVNGNAQKANSELLEGFVEIKILGIDFSFTGKTKEGQFNLSFTIPDDASAGSYEIITRAYEKDALEEIINEGTTKGIIRINQIIKEIGIALNTQSVSPTEEFSYSILLYDQARETAEKEVSVVIYKPDGSVFEKKVARGGETNYINLENNSPPGYWKIQSKINELETTKEFFVEEFKEISFSLENKTLTIVNVGNTPYTGPVEIAIGETKEIKELEELGVGESKKFELLAPDGEYSIEVLGGAKRENLGTTFLTGRAISVRDITGGFFGTSFKILIGLIIILIIAVVVVYFYKKISRGKFHSGKILPGKKTDIAQTSTSSIKKSEGQAPHLIDKGEKQEASIISLKIKNMQEISSKDSHAVKSIDSALWRAKESGAKIYSDGEYRIMIFTQATTKEKDNTLKAIRIAQSIERVLKSHNRAGQKVEFGIGVNTGTMIVESKNGKFKFMSLDNTIAATKRISEISNSEILISEAIHRKTVGKIKTTKTQDKNLWKIEKITDRGDHSDYVRKFGKK